MLLALALACPLFAGGERATLACGDSPAFATMPSPPLAGTNIKALHASWSTFPYTLTDAVVSISGNQIGITQTGSYTGPPPLPTLYCLSTSALLGALPEGHYDVTWQLSTPQGVETFHDSIDVLDPAAVPTLQRPFLLLLALAMATTSVFVLRR